jgi:hypothetical protein
MVRCERQSMATADLRRVQQAATGASKVSGNIAGGVTQAASETATRAVGNDEQQPRHNLCPTCARPQW